MGNVYNLSVKKLLIALIFFLVLIPASAYAKIGVGVGTGKIVVEEDLKPGIIYELPSLTVFNTGDVSSEYEVNIAYHEKQPELQPPEDWFEFNPDGFHLEPGEAQEVKIKLNLPVKAQPGDYFAYLEGHPLSTSTDGSTTVGIAAAAKLYFTVVPGTFLEGIYYKALSFWNIYYPIPQIVLGFILIVSLFFIAKKYIKIEVNLKKTDKGSAQTENPEDKTDTKL